MKKPTLYKWDYIVVGLGLAFMFGLASTEGLSSVLIVPVIAICIAIAIYLLKRIFSEKSMEAVEKAVVWIKNLIEGVGVYAVVIGFAITVLWFGFKVVASCFQWLKTGYWGLYEYEPACSALGFSCLPSTDFVKVNEFLFWINHFDVTIFLFFSIIAVVLAWAWFLKILKAADE